MKEYKIKTVQYLVFEKTVYVEAKNKTEAKNKAKNNDWYDAEGDEYTGDIICKKVDKIEEI
tara:strand:+ start:3424 stop:3606 length:183 start_codon:yes stop_codon:yes gene_type:complete